MSGYFPESETFQNGFVSVGSHTVIQQNPGLIKFRRWLKDAVEKSREWRDQAREDLRFVVGDQWRKEDKQALTDQGRPPITVNRIKPQVNILSGYQRLNRYDIEFAPRTKDDSKLCEVRKGVTKYIMDACDYPTVESQVFVDGAIGGLGWFEVKYQWDYSSLDGEAVICRESPFNMYVDPESRKNDYSDAKYIIRAKWVDKEELATIYPEQKELIYAQTDVYDKDEDDNNTIDPLWYQKDTKKLRLVECWYKERTRETFWLTQTEELIPKKEFSVDGLRSGALIKPVTLPHTKVKVCVFVGEVELEHIDSPYEHGEFPFVPFTVFYFGEGDTPAGIVRDVKDPQRELNKRRSQALHILNTQANSGWLYEEGSLKPEQEEKIKNIGAMPGAMLEVAIGALTGGKVQRIEPGNPPTAILEAAAESKQDIPDITGINEALMGTDIAASSSGRAIELKQKQAVTHIAPMFDNLRRAKRQITCLLWGKRNQKGIIPQYYTEPKIFRIIGDNGQPQFVSVNQPVQVNDPLHGVIQTTLNDLSQGEFDVVIADTPASSTQRAAQFWSLTDAISKLGIPGDMVFDLLIDLSDIPEKEEIKKRWLARQQQQQQAQQSQALAAQQKASPNISESISFKDAPLPIQLEMAAKAGLIPQQVADEVLQQFIQQYLPHMTAGGPSSLPPGSQQEMQNQRALQVQDQQGGPPAPALPQQRANPLTAAAVQSVMAGQTPGMG